MSRRIRNFPKLAFLTATLSLLLAASMQPVLAQPTPPVTLTNLQRPPIPIEHLYWYFMLYQSHLDTKAAELDSQGKGGAPLGGTLQKGLGWSDGDFAYLRNSAN